MLLTNPNKKMREVAKMSDEELVELALQKEEMFGVLMNRYEPKLTRYIRRITNVSAEGAEDILQEVFIKVYKNLRGFERDLKFSSWVYRIAHNEVISQHRKLKGKDVSLDAENEEGGNLKEMLADALDVHEEQISQETSKKVRAAIAELPAKYREVLVLRYLEEMSYEEISDVLRKPSGTVATLINRAKEKFRRVAEKYELYTLI